MPPRYAYWTILVDEQPTAFRAGALEDLMPTFNRLKEKHPSAKMMWFQNGQLWPSRQDAQEFMRNRGDRGRERDPRQVGKPSAGRPFTGRRDEPGERPEWKPKGAAGPGERPAWKPKGTGTGRPVGRRDEGERPEWKPKGSSGAPPIKSERGGKSGWKPSYREGRPSLGRPFTGRSQEAKPGAARPFKGRRDEGKPSWKPKAPADAGGRPAWKPKPSDGGKLEWKPKGAGGPAPTRGDQPSRGEASGSPAPKRKWVPKEEYKKSLGIEPKRDSKWRPGGDHKDPRQKYKDAKKAKWTRFKQTIRARSGKKRGSN